MNRAVTPGRLHLAGRAVRVLQQHGALRDSDLLAVLACEPEELGAAIPVMIRWRKVDRCGDFLVPVARQSEGRRSA